MQFLFNHATAGGSSRINIKTADDHVYAGSNGNLYLEVCDTNDSKTCCKQTFDGPFKAGAENIFAFNTAFQKCLESSKKLFYFVGLTVCKRGRVTLLIFCVHSRSIIGVAG